jgi:predicted transcriptional regulator
MTTATALAPLTLTEERVLTLLGSGLPAETVAASVGITPSAVSQLLSDENFASQVAELRYKSLAKHNERDTCYDELEDTVLRRLKETIPMMHRPLELLKASQILNQAKRRGASTPEALTQKQQVINLTIPIQVLNQFKTNAQGQVVSVGEQSLITIQSNNLDSLVTKQGAQNDSTKRLPNGSTGGS